MSVSLRTWISLFWLIASSAVLNGTTLWYEDNNLGVGAGMPADFKDKFQRPETWENARQFIDVYLIRANSLTASKNAIDDSFLEENFIPVLNQTGVTIALDVQGATWMHHRDKTRIVDEEIALARKLRELGGNVTHLSLQSVLSKPQTIDGKRVEYPMKLRYADVVDYATRATEELPGIKIGIIDALPSHGKEYHIPYRELARRMRAAGLSLDHIHLDIPFEIPEKNRNGMSWEKVKEVEDFVRNEIGCQFGLVCTSRVAGYDSDKAYHQAVLSSLKRYSRIGGDPDQYLIMSWFPHPAFTIPDSAQVNDYPLMRTVVEFGQRLDEIYTSNGKVTPN